MERNAGPAGSVFEQAWNDYGHEAGRLIEQYKPKFCKIVRRWARNQTEFEDMYSDAVVWRMPRFIETWDPIKGDMMFYIFKAVNWYCVKYINRNKRHKHSELVDVERATVTDNFMLDELSEIDAYVLKYRYIEEFTLKEMSDSLGVTVSEFRSMCNEALGNARRLFESE